MRGSRIGVTALVLGLFLGLLATAIFWFTSSEDERQGRGSPEVSRTNPPPGRALRPADAEKVATEREASSGPALEGRVVDALEQPIRDAEIEVFRDDLTPDADAFARTSSDERGAFRIQVPPATRYLVRISHDDFAPLENRTGIYVEDAAVSLGLLTLEVGLVLQGRILDPRGRAVPDVEVLLRPEVRVERAEHGRDVRRRRTNTDGSFRFGALSARAYRLQLVADAPWADSVVSGLFPGLPDAEGVDLTLERGHSMRGRVVDDDGRPVAAARVFATCRDAPRARAYEGWTTSSGAFEFERVPSGIWRLDIRHGTRVTEVDFALPAPERRFTLSAGKDQPLQLIGSPLPRALRWRLTWPSAGETRSPWQSAPIENGATVLRDLPSYELQADYDVELRVAGHARRFVTRARLATGAAIQLVREARLAVQLTPGSAAVGFPERLRLRSILAPRFHDDARPDGEGRLRFGQLPSGSYVLEDARSGATLLEARLETGTDVERQLSWPPSSGRLVVEIASDPALGRGFELHVWSLAGGFRDLRSATAGAALSFPGLRAGRYGLRLRPSSGTAPSSAASSTGTDVPTKIVEVLANRSVRVRLP